jgi:predicted transcriptional regulator
MFRLMAYFRKAHLTIISEKMAERLAHTVRNMTQVDAAIMLGVTGSDVSALLPRRGRRHSGRASRGPGGPQGFA